MKMHNKLALERLSNICDLCGFFSVLIGFIIIFMDLLDRDLQHLQVGIYIFAMGYGSVKISQQIIRVVTSEEKNQPFRMEEPDWFGPAGKRPPSSGRR